jgi:hypothetical protein
MTQSDWVDVPFGVDFSTSEVIFLGGRRTPVEAWRDPMGFECEPKNARAAIFRVSGGVPLALDLFACHTPDGMMQ